MIISTAVEKMIEFYGGNLHDIEHFLKVWAFAKNIGEKEKLDAHTQKILELASVVHDIACPLCREKYGNRTFWRIYPCRSVIQSGFRTLSHIITPTQTLTGLTIRFYLKPTSLSMQVRADIKFLQ